MFRKGLAKDTQVQMITKETSRSKRRMSMQQMYLCFFELHPFCHYVLPNHLHFYCILIRVLECWWFLCGHMSLSILCYTFSEHLHHEIVPKGSRQRCIFAIWNWIAKRSISILKFFWCISICIVFPLYFQIHFLEELVFVFCLFFSNVFPFELKKAQIYISGTRVI